MQSARNTFFMKKRYLSIPFPNHRLIYEILKDDETNGRFKLRRLGHTFLLHSELAGTYVAVYYNKYPLKKGSYIIEI